MKFLHFVENSGNVLFAEEANWEIDGDTALNLMKAGVLEVARTERIPNCVMATIYKKVGYGKATI